MPKPVIRISGNVIEAWCPRCPKEMHSCYVRSGTAIEICDCFHELETVDWQPLVFCELDKEGTLDV
jgi:hypothetical protein